MIRRNLRPAVLILALLAGPIVRGVAAEYHVDADQGDDAASGLAPDKAGSTCSMPRLA